MNRLSLTQTQINRNIIIEFSNSQYSTDIPKVFETIEHIFLLPTYEIDDNFKLIKEKIIVKKGGTITIKNLYIVV